MFLLMVFMSFIFNEFKELHWLGKIEAKLAKLGKMESVEVVMALCVLLLLESVLPPEEALEALTAGIAAFRVATVSHNGSSVNR